MKIDVIVANPPYQDNVDGSKTQAKAIYHKFIVKAKENCTRSVFIVPARWFIGGLALGNFTDFQLNCGNVEKMIYYPNQKEIFPTVGIAGGIVIIYQNELKHSNKANYTFVNNGVVVENTERTLNEFPIFISNSIAASIIRKTQQFTSMRDIVGCISTYKLSTSYRGENKTDTYYNVVTSKGIYKIDTEERRNLGIRPYMSCLTSDSAGQQTKSGTYRVFSGLGIMDEYTICTDSYIPVGVFSNYEEAQNLIKYLKTKFVRAIVQVNVCGIHITRDKFRYVPIQDFQDKSDIDWNDAVANIDKQLYKKYGLDEAEIDYIESTIQEI